MLFNSFQFLIFFLTIYLLYNLLPARKQNFLLLVASYIFYGAWDPRFIALIFVSTCIAYLGGKKIDGSNNEKTRRAILLVTVAISLSILGFFKYFNFFLDSLISVLTFFGIASNPRFLSIILPVGISFYTFQVISYLVDVYKQKIQPVTNFWDFALYVSFFPQLVAGPIERATHFLPQILNPRIITVEKVRKGLWLVLLGFYQKLVIADGLANAVNSIFSDTVPSSGGAALVGTYMFAFQIYGDFAGYSNIARGVSYLMGFELMENFHSPYFARNPTDFWRRWHISLSTWLRDYLYIPLGGSKGNKFKTYKNLLITMLLGGLWHGAAWTFIIWGGLHGIILIGYRALGLTQTDYRKNIEKINLKTIVSILIIFHLNCLAWIYFRAGSIEQANAFTSAIFLSIWDWESFNIAGNLHHFRLLVKLVWFMVLIDGISWFQNNQYWVLKKAYIIRLSCFLWLSLSILLWGAFNSDEFIYFQF